MKGFCKCCCTSDVEIEIYHGAKYCKLCSKVTNASVMQYQQSGGWFYIVTALCAIGNVILKRLDVLEEKLT